MIQKPIRDYNASQYALAEGAELIKELNDRTRSGQAGYNSIDELATKVQAIVVGTETTTIENEYADIAAMLNNQANQTQGAIQFVADASADPNITNGYAYYEYLGLLAGALTDYRLLSQQETVIIETGNQKVEDQNGNAFATALKVIYGLGFTVKLLPGGGYKLDYEKQDRHQDQGALANGTLTLDITAYETFTAVLTEATTIAISNPIIKAVTLDVRGNFALSYPAGSVVVGDTYNGAVGAKVVIEYKPSITFITVTNYA